MVSLRRILLGCALAAAVSIGISQERGFWSDPEKLQLLGIERLAAGDAVEAVPLLETAARLRPGSVLEEAWLASTFHLERRLDEAGRHYRRVLELEPPAPLDAARRSAILRHAPRVFQVRSEPFPLLDAVAIHHPSEPAIAYHFFWADDIDFPSDHDPCDHELAWVRYDPPSRKLVALETYFHGRILSTGEAVEDAARFGGRPRVHVQWGKHGSLPLGWERLSIRANSGDIERRYLDLERPQTLEQYVKASYRKLVDIGRNELQNPLTGAWPKRFDGTWEDFVRFEREVPILQHLEAGKLAVSRWSSAMLEQRFLAYNFRPKTEWPDRPGAVGLAAQLDRRVGMAGSGLLGASEAAAIRQSASRSPDPLLASLVPGAALPDGRLPPMELFRPETPRFPNLWIYGPADLYESAGALAAALERRLRSTGLHSSEVVLNEGADTALSLEHLEPWGAVPGLAHAHAVHIRLFWKKLERAGLDRIELDGAFPGAWRRIAASVHYEVEHAHGLHADVRICPRCGRTGGYAASTGNLVEVVHDPLGLELIVRGQIRGAAVVDAAGRELPSLTALTGAAPADIFVTPPSRQDMNTAAVGAVFLRTKI